MGEVIRVQEKYYVLASSSLADQQNRVIKEGDSFAVFNRWGDIQNIGLAQNGIYYEGTRFISQLEFRLGQKRPLLLSSAANQSNTMLAIDLTNPDTFSGSTIVAAKGSVHIRRFKLLWQGVYYENIVIENMGIDSLELAVSLLWDADFIDIFEVRGFKRGLRGELAQPNTGEQEVVLGYFGLDGITRRSRIGVTPVPARISGNSADFTLSLTPKRSTVVTFDVSFEVEEQRSRKIGFEKASHLSQAETARATEEGAQISSSHDQFNELVNRSVADLKMLTTDTPYGPYPYAGIPWFNTVFGRDGLITAFETLWLRPEISLGVLKYLARTQATSLIEEKDAEPGKILHETRTGEMATLQEIPFDQYYGTVDATPLFIVLAAAYFKRTGDLELPAEIWPNIEQALLWMDIYGDKDGDGFLEYHRQTGRGLVNQGWKDSDDSAFHSDGTLAEGPIALCEVQAYAYQARLAASELAAVLGKEELATELRERAHELQRKFEQVFWQEELGCYALALDGEKRPCAVRTSNAGHALFSGIASQQHAQILTDVLLQDHFFCGWGIRTVSAHEKRYSPISYHNGSVWPHDNAMIAYGFARYGFKEAAARILTALFEASIFAELRRLPELFCGFTKQPGLGPTFYPVACSPQAWAAGSVFLVLQACLGLTIDGRNEQLEFNYPYLPPFLDCVHIRNLSVGDSTLDITCQRYYRDFGINVDRRTGTASVTIRK